MSTPPTPAAEATRKLLATLWERNRPLILERIDELDRAANSAATASLTADDLRSAHSTAHKLAGSLGMFGYPEGTELARSIEHLLQAAADNADGHPTPAQALTLRELTVALRQALSL
jgi:HPt (histidine-containing phosphotransfer) domain-containing protein